MAKKKLEFPEGFLWGTATAGHQIEGHNENSDWWRFEQEGKVDDGSRTERNVDYWNRYEEDHALMAKLGYQSFRLGIEWAKIEPEDGRFDQDAIEHYRKILESLRSHGIKICLTLYHWVLPDWFAQKGSWMRPDAVKRFLRYCRVVIKELGEYPDLWVTLNEPFVPAFAGYFIGQFPPEKKSPPQFFIMMRRMLKAHAGCYKLIHELAPKAPDGGPAMAGVATAYQWVEPFGSDGLAGVHEKLLTDVYKKLSFGGWDKAVATGRMQLPFGTEKVPGLKDSYDFCGVNYYMRASLKFDPGKPEQLFVDADAIPDGIETTQMGWQIYPPGFYGTLMDVWNIFKKPIYITENGIADDVDAQRPKYLLEHIAQVHRAIEDGAKIDGYFQWSYIDNFEWKEGFCKKFGLVECSHTDPKLERKPRPSAKMYSDIIKKNAITETTVKKYAPEANDGVFGDRWR